jgi:Right handed beta helix region
VISSRPRDLAAVLVVGAIVVAALPAAGKPSSSGAESSAANSPVLVAAGSARAKGASSIRLRRPARVQAGHVLIAAIAIRRASARAIKPPAGWKLLRRDSKTFRDVALAQALYYRVASAQERPAYRWRFPRSRSAVAGLLVYGGADSGRPLLGLGGSSARNGRRIAVPRLVTQVSGARVVGLFAVSGQTRLRSPRGMTKRYEVGGGGRAGLTSSAADMAKATPGAVARRTAGTTSTRGVLISQLVALRPAGGTSPAPPPPPGSPAPPAPPLDDGDALPARLPPSTGQTFYVATTGSDSNPGTLEAPWRNVQHALDVLQPGQRALVRGGTYAESLGVDRAGTAAATITIENYPGERPVVNGGGQRPLEVSSTGAYTRVRGFVFERSPYTSGGNVDLYGHHVEISGNEIRLAKDQGLYSDEDSRNLQIVGNWIHHNGEGVTHQSHGIYLQGNDHLVANNVIHDHSKGFGIQVYDRNSRSIVTANTVTGAGHSGIVVGGSGGVDNVRVHNNVFAFNAHYGISHDSACPTASQADHNVVFGNAWGPTQGGCPGLDYSGGNRTGDPLFANYGGRNLHLVAGSPAIDYSLRAYSPGDDHDGRRRPQGAAPDAGAYEHP